MNSKWVADGKIYVKPLKPHTWQYNDGKEGSVGCSMLAGVHGMPEPGADIVYRNIYTEFGMEVSESKWSTPPKKVENGKAKLLQDE